MTPVLPTSFQHPPPSSITYTLSQPYHHITHTIPPASTWSSPLHYHKIHTEFLHVRQGSLLLRLNKETKVYSPEDGEIEIEPGVWHSWRSAASHPHLSSELADDLIVEQRMDPDDGANEIYCRNMNCMIAKERSKWHHQSQQSWFRSWTGNSKHHHPNMEEDNDSIELTPLTSSRPTDTTMPIPPSPTLTSHLLHPFRTLTLSLQLLYLSLSLDQRPILLPIFPTLTLFLISHLLPLLRKVSILPSPAHRSRTGLSQGMNPNQAYYPEYTGNDLAARYKIDRIKRGEYKAWTPYQDQEDYKNRKGEQERAVRASILGKKGKGKGKKEL